jgi:hypothetical protein
MDQARAVSIERTLNRFKGRYVERSVTISELIEHNIRYIEADTGVLGAYIGYHVREEGQVGFDLSRTHEEMSVNMNELLRLTIMLLRNERYSWADIAERMTLSSVRTVARVEGFTRQSLHQRWASTVEKALDELGHLSNKERHEQAHQFLAQEAIAVVAHKILDLAVKDRVGLGSQGFEDALRIGGELMESLYINEELIFEVEIPPLTASKYRLYTQAEWDRGIRLDEDRNAAKGVRFSDDDPEIELEG